MKKKNNNRSGVKMNKKVEVIGIDHGFGYTKTVSTIVKSGVKECEMEPAFLNSVVELKGKFYIVGEKRRSYIPDKTQTLDYYILTLAAIAKEIKLRGLKKEGIEVCLGVGLPLDFFALQKNSFRSYLMKKNQVFFKFEGELYLITIKDVHVYPQGYSAIIKEAGKYNDKTIVVDIGTGTVDILPIENKIPVVSKCESLELGVFVLIERIKKAFRQKYGFSIEEDEVQRVLQKTLSNLPEEYKSFITREIKRYIEELQEELLQRKIDIRYQKVLFCGGGAFILKEFGDKYEQTVSFITDIHANAKGYEFLEKCMK